MVETVAAATIRTIRETLIKGVHGLHIGQAPLNIEPQTVISPLGVFLLIYQLATYTPNSARLDTEEEPLSIERRM